MFPPAIFNSSTSSPTLVTFHFLEYHLRFGYEVMSHTGFNISLMMNCDIVIYNKKKIYIYIYIFSLCPVSGAELLKLLKFTKWGEQ